LEGTYNNHQRLLGYFSADEHLSCHLLKKSRALMYSRQLVQGCDLQKEKMRPESDFNQ